MGYAVKITKTKTSTYTVTYVVENYSVFDRVWREIREKFKYQGFSCFICNKRFVEGEHIGLIMLKESSNKVCCNECIFKAKEDLREGKR